jgi:hypothetical protein
MKNENIKFNSKIESFLDKTLDNLKNGIASNTEFTKKFINGNWTCLTTTVDSNYNVTNLMKVNINEQQNNDKNYGNIIIDNSTYNIVLLTNENIIANVENNTSTIHIKLINKFNKNDDKLSEKLIYKNDIPKCIISQYIGNNLLYKYISYKVYNNKVNSELYRIILSGNYYIGKLPQIYNYYVYNKILNNYIYPSNYLSCENFRDGPSDIINTLKTKYSNGLIRFCIQRVFTSPSYGNTEIITKLSPPVQTFVLMDNKIVDKLKIVSFNDDKNANGLKQFLRPKATILYFYVFTDSTDSYGYKENHIAIPADFLSLSWLNQAQNMFNNKVISFDNVLSVEKIITNNFSLAKVSKQNSDMENPTFFDFSDLYPLL